MGRWGERIKDHRRAAEEDVPISADEVRGGVSHHDDEVQTPFLVLPAQEVEVHSLVVGMRKPANIEVFGVQVHTIAEAFGEQPRHLPLRDHVELLIRARRVEDEYLLRAVGVLRTRERGEDARREGHCQQRLTPNATPHGQHAPGTNASL